MPDVRLYLLGSPRLDLDGQPVKMETRKTIALLAFLGMTGESYRRDSLVNLLWPDYDLSHGRGVLRRTLSALNAALPDGWVRADRETIGLAPEADLWLDVSTFRGLLADCRSHPHPADAVCPDCLGLLSKASALYRDDFMSGFSLSDAVNFDDWQFFQAEGLRQDLGGVLAKLARCLVLRADFPAAVEVARRRVALDRLDEEAQRDLILLYAWNDQRSAALRQCQECREELRSQLGVEPQPATIGLFHQLETGRLPAPPVDPAWQSPLHKAAPLPPVLPVETARPAAEEKRILTLLACELSGLDASPGPDGEPSEDGAGFLDKFLSLASGVLDIYGGRIAYWLGRSALIVFGLDHSRENDPELAVRAALVLREQCERAGVCLTAGIASGEIFVRQPLRLTGAALDQALYLASRASCGQILAAASVHQFCRRAFVFTPLSSQGPHAGPPQQVYLVERLNPDVRLARGGEPFRAGLVGRESELSQLVGVLEGLSSGKGWMVMLSGEPGVGKTRLVEELCAAQTIPGLLWLEGRCLELSAESGYWPFIDLLKQYFAWQASSSQNDRLVADAIRALAAQGWLGHSRAEELIPVFLRLLSSNSGQSADWSAAQSPEETRQQIFLAVRDFLVALSGRQPLVLVLEDLHWGDPLSLDLLSILMETLDQSPLCLICAFRPDPEYRTVLLPGIAAHKCRGRFSEIRLSELTRAQSLQLVDGLLGDSSLGEGVKELVWERCKGNPYFIQEILQSLVDTGFLYRQNAQWKTSGPLDTALLPSTLQSTILARLDHLEEDWRLVLQIAAVLGRVFRRRVLEHALHSEADLDRALWELEGRGLIYQERLVPEVEYSFQHVLLQDAVYHNILRNRRKLLHQRAAEAMEALYPNRLNEMAEHLAYHYEKSGNIKHAIFYLYQAGEKARADYSNEAAILHLNKGLELLRSLPESPERCRQEIDFLILMGVPLFHSRGHADPDVLRVYEEARDLCVITGEEEHLFEALLGLRRYYLYHGQIETARLLSRQMLDLAERQKNPYGLARACMMLAEVFFREGEVLQALEWGRRGLVLSEGLNPRTSIFLYGNDTGLGNKALVTISLWHVGLPDQARREAEDQQALSKALSHPFTRAFIIYLTAHYFILVRDPGMVRRLAEEELHIAEERGYALYQGWGAVQLGWAIACQGQVEDGLKWIQRGLDCLQSTKFGLIQEDEFLFLGEVLLLSGQVELAFEVIGTALQAIERTGAAEAQAELFRLQALAFQRQNRLQEAETSFIQAVQSARRQASRGFELRAATGLARLWLEQARVTEARELLQPLYAAYTEGLETADLADARALLAELG